MFGGLDLWLGVGLGVLAATSASAGQTLQHLSKLRVQKLEVKPPPWCRPTWWAGQGLYTMANWFDVASLIFAPMSIIIVIYALRLPMVALMAAVILHANVSRACALGIGIIGAAAGISLVYAPKDKSSPFSRPTDFFTTPTVVYLVVSVFAWIIIGFDFWREQGQRGTGIASTADSSPLRMGHDDGPYVQCWLGSPATRRWRQMVSSGVDLASWDYEYSQFRGRVDESRRRGEPVHSHFRADGLWFPGLPHGLAGLTFR